MARESTEPSRSDHPTAQALIEATIAELDRTGDLGLRMEAVTERAGVSLGAIYHHFGDKDGLIDAARIEQFTRHADRDTAALRDALATIHRHDDLFRVLPGILDAFHTAERRPWRARRLANLAATLTRPDYARRIADIQHRVTHDLAAIIDGLKARGAVDGSTDSLACATFIQAYTVGHIVADVDREPVSDRRWNAAVLGALRSMLPAPQGPGSTVFDPSTRPVSGSDHHSNARGQATARAMLDAALEQFETRTEQDFRVDEVLARVGVSPSSLYHHFGSREGLMEATWIDWARRNADEDVELLAGILRAARTPDEAMHGVTAAVQAAQAPGRTERRVQRLMVVAAAARRPHVRAEIGAIETDTNNRYTAILEDARNRGVLGRSADLSVVPVFVRAFTFGRVTNELSTEPAALEAWNAVVADVLSRLLGHDDIG
jgi:AcrR family transcriptional regulator